KREIPVVPLVARSVASCRRTDLVVAIELDAHAFRQMPNLPCIAHMGIEALTQLRLCPAQYRLKQLRAAECVYLVIALHHEQRGIAASPQRIVCAQCGVIGAAEYPLYVVKRQVTSPPGRDRLDRAIGQLTPLVAAPVVN